MDSMTMKMDAQYKEIQSCAKCNHCGEFVILEMEEDSKVPLILGRPFLHTADAVIHVKQKQLYLGVGTIDVIDEILEEDFDALLDEGRKILYSIEGTPLEDKIFAELDEFIDMNIEENTESESNKKEITYKKITFDTDYKINKSLDEPPTDLELKSLLDHLEYAFFEESSFLPVIISSQLSEQNKNKLVSVLKRHKQAFAWKTTYILESVEVFMDDFSVFGNSFDNCLNNLDKMLQRCKDANLVPNWEKRHFMVKEGIFLGHRVSGAGLEVDKAKIDIKVDDDLHDLRSVEAEFPAIVNDDAFTPQDALPCKSQVSTPVNDKIDFRISFDESDDEDYTIVCDKNSFPYKLISVNNLKTDSENDNEKADLLTEPTLSPQHIDEFSLNVETSVTEYDEEEQNSLYFNNLFPFNIIRPDDLKLEKDNNDNDIDIIQSSEGNEITHSLYVPFGIPFDPKRYYKDGDYAMMSRRPRMRMEHRDDAGVALFTSQAEGRLFDTKGSLVRELILEFLSTLRFREVLLDLDAPDTIQFQLFRATRRLSWRQFILALGLHTWKEMESLDFTSIAGRSQAPEKVTMTDLFYLRGLDVGSVNVPYLLARYLRSFAAGRISGAHISGGQFVARLAKHFGLLIVEILGGLMVISPELLIIDMGELVRLQICMEVDDIWAWVAVGPERQPDAAAGAPRVTQDALIVDEGGHADPTPVQEPPPPAPARTMPQRMARLEYGYIRNHMKIIKNGQARTRDSEEYKAEARKVKPQSNPVKEKSIMVNKSQQD
ncbi:hypothetical protein Tco_0763934 [Tanacetum coccineum]